MFAHRGRNKRRGQSLPLLALIIVVLFGMVGLAVDVGNTYASQRDAERVTTAAAIAGMDMYLKEGTTDANVAKVIHASFESNNMAVLTGVTPVMVPGQTWMRAFYLDDYGKPLCQVGFCNNKPGSAKYIEVRVNGTVETYFARVLNRPTLPIDAKSYVGQCSPTDSIYPLAIKAEDIGFVQGITGKTFNKPAASDELPYWIKYSDENYPSPRYQRRIYLRDGPPGSFSFLRWKADQNNAGSKEEQERMFLGDGNIDEGYSEWLDNSGKPSWPSTTRPKPDGYPQLPKQFNTGDWVAGNPGVIGGSIASLYEQHIKARTEMIMPIVDESAGGGNNTAYHVNSLGVFLMRGYGNQPSKGFYFDLVYLKDVAPKPCEFTEVPSPPQPPTIVGQVSVRPMWKDVVKNDRPVAYQMIMDASGSMSYNFAGAGTINGNNVQCELNNNDTNQANYPYPFASCQGGPGGYWSKVQERRIYITKKAMESFIDEMDPQDTMQIIKFSSTGNGPVDVNGDNKGDSSDWSGDKALLKAAVTKAGSYKNDPYLSEGGTSGPQAMQKAREMLKTNPPKKSPDGREYRPVTIYLTDGVANIFLNGTGNNAEDICQDIYAAFSDKNLATTITKNTPRCQLGYSSKYGQERPITSMVTVANAMKKDNEDLALYVVALAGTDATGLDQVSTNPSMTYLATNPTLVQSILKEINTVIENSECLTKVDPIANVIDSSHTPSGTGYPSGVFGYVKITDSNGKPLSSGKSELPISHDPATGVLMFRQNPGESIAPGLYRLEAHIFYKGDDGVTRKYTEIYDKDTGKGASSIALEITPGGLGGVRAIDPIVLQSNADTLCPK